MEYPEIFEFFVEGGDQAMSHVLLHITEPSTSEEMMKGYFFAVVEMKGASIEQIEHMQQIIDDLETGYYETENGIDKGALEITLEYLNRRSDLVLSKNTDMHCLVGTYADGALNFSYHGRPHAVLYYSVGDDLKSVDILEGQEEQGDQLFSALMEGAMNVGDFFFVASPDIKEYFTYDRIQKIITGRSTKQSVEHVQKVLDGLRGETSFGGLLIHALTHKDRPITGKQPKERVGAAASLNNLMNAEKHTRDTLAPPLFQHLKGIMQKQSPQNDHFTSKPTKKSKKRKIKTATPETNHRVRNTPVTQGGITNKILISIGRTLVHIARMLWYSIRFVLLVSARTLLTIFVLITNKNNGRRHTLDMLINRYNDKKQAIASLPLISKVLFIATIVAAVVFACSILYLHVKGNIDAERLAYEQTLQAIKDKHSAASASMIYGDDQKALTLLNEAKELLNTISVSSKERKGTHETLVTTTDTILDELRNLSVITPTRILNVKQLKDTASTEHLARIENTLIAYGSNDDTLYTYNTVTQASETSVHSNISGLTNDTTPKEQDVIIFLNNDGRIGRYNKDTHGITNEDISFPEAQTRVMDGFIYNIRLYTLAPEQNQIYRHSKTQTGYDKATSWLQEEADLSDGVSIAIDGDVFVLTSAGNIKKFVSGRQQPFDIQNLYPELDAPTDIWTYNDIDNIYILEPTNRRIIVLNKQGKLIKQYTADEWSNPTGMIVDEEVGVVYVLDDNTIYSFELI